MENIHGDPPAYEEKQKEIPIVGYTCVPQSDFISPPSGSKITIFHGNPPTVLQYQCQQPLKILPAHTGRGLRHPRYHLIVGIGLVGLGLLTMILDPLLPALLGYPYSIFLAGLFMLISGMASIFSVKRKRRSFLSASLTMDILASINLFFGFLSGVLFTLGFIEFKNRTRLAVFYAIYCILIFLLMIFDCCHKCAEVCCCRPTLYDTQIYITGQECNTPEHP